MLSQKEVNVPHGLPSYADDPLKLILTKTEGIKEFTQTLTLERVNMEPGFYSKTG